jgi:hypothetical protein
VEQQRYSNQQSVESSDQEETKSAAKKGAARDNVAGNLGGSRAENGVEASLSNKRER